MTPHPDTYGQMHTRRLIRAGLDVARASSRVVGDSSPVLSRAAEACCSAATCSSTSAGLESRLGGHSSFLRGSQRQIVTVAAARGRSVHVDATQSSLDDVGVVDPFSLVSEELSGVSERMRRAVVSEVRARAFSPGQWVKTV